jgi:methylmalonyl-CoA mutase
MSNKNTKLFEAFPPTSTEDWKNKIVADLKGADYDKKMVWRTNEGIAVQPFYRLEDVEKLSYLDVTPGQFPFTRGTCGCDNSWYIRQDVKVTNPAEANKKALEIVCKGITSIGFTIEDSSKWTASDVASLLKDIHLPAVEVNFNIGCGKSNLLKLFVDYVKASSFDVCEVRGSINIGYLTGLSLKGAYCHDSEATCTKSLAENLTIAKDLCRFKVVLVKGDIFQNSGSNITQELAFALAMGEEYLNQAVENGIKPACAAKKIKFDIAVGGNYFFEIAKIRAARLLWAKIVEAYKPADQTDCCCKEAGKDHFTDAGKMNVHAITSTWNKTVYDPHVNLLRTQTEAMSAVLGGANSITVLPFNVAYEQPTEFSERIARNQQILLKEEAYMDKIVDPAAGSYYIEQLTDMVAEKAWSLFLEVQDKGGYSAAFKAGFIQDKIKATLADAEKAIATRRSSVLGTNQFPNFNEMLDEKFDTTIFNKQNQKSDKAIAEPLQICRGAQAFELLRFKTDKFAKTNGRPKVFMLTIGNITMQKARSLFACNFFACAGFEVVDNASFKSVDEGVAAAKASGAKIVVICSSDDEYAVLAPEAFEKLGSTIFVIAGAPTCTDELKAKGIQNFISVKSNVLETLQQYQTLLGIK